MMKTNNSQQQHVAKPYSEDYKRIKSQAESKWPTWKVNAYNNFASSRAQKINVSK